jgi:cytochrome P450
MIELNPYDRKFADDPYPIYKRLRDEAPVYHNESLNFWAISRFADVLNAHKDFATFSSAGGVTIEGGDAGSAALICKDPPEHRWHKALMTRVFTPQRMSALEPFIRNLVTSLLDKAAENDEFDFVQDFAVLLPLEVISELIGIPKEYRHDIHNFANKMLDRDKDADRADIAAAGIAANRLYLQMVQERRANLGDDPISYLIQADVEEVGGGTRRLADSEMMTRFLELAVAGHETVSKAIPNGAMAFQRFPDQRKRLIGDPGLLATTIDEVLRFDPPSQLQGRTTTRDVTLHGVTIPKGSKTMLLTGAATRDERKYENPDVFDISRRPAEAIYFGFGIHHCLGVHLARLELKIAFEELFRKFPNFEVDPDRATRPVLSNVRGAKTLPARLGMRSLTCYSTFQQ